MTKEELDKLAEKYQDDNTIIRYYGPGNGTVPEYNKTMDEVFKDGWNACRKQMMKEAVEERVQRAPLNGPLGISAYCCNFPSNHPFYHCKEGDKVRIIIVKED